MFHPRSHSHILTNWNQKKNLRPSLIAPSPHNLLPNFHISPLTFIISLPPPVPPFRITLLLLSFPVSSNFQRSFTGEMAGEYSQIRCVSCSTPRNIVFLTFIVCLMYIWCCAFWKQFKEMIIFLLNCIEEFL